MRLSLSCFQTFPSDNQVVQKFVKSISKPAESGSKLTLVPKSQGEWTTLGIRHKKRHAYLCDRKKSSYLITITSIEAYKFKRGDLEQSAFTLMEKDWEKHYETEVYQMISCMMCNNSYY